VCVRPLQAAGKLGEYLLRAREDVEVLGVLRLCSGTVTPAGTMPRMTHSALSSWVGRLRNSMVGPNTWRSDGLYRHYLGLAVDHIWETGALRPGLTRPRAVGIT
jgi:hypothetical protein